MNTKNLLQLISALLPAVEHDFFLMSNLPSAFTGLPFIVWISVRGRARHDIRVKIARGPKVKPKELISVALRPELREIGGNQLTAAELKLLGQWVDLNRDVLLAHWNEDIDTVAAIARLKPLTPPAAQ